MRGFYASLYGTPLAHRLCDPLGSRVSGGTSGPPAASRKPMRRRLTMSTASTMPKRPPEPDGAILGGALAQQRLLASEGDPTDLIRPVPSILPRGGGDVPFAIWWGRRRRAGSSPGSFLSPPRSPASPSLGGTPHDAPNHLAPSRSGRRAPRSAWRSAASSPPRPGGSPPGVAAAYDPCPRHRASELPREEPVSSRPAGLHRHRRRRWAERTAILPPLPHRTIACPMRSTWNPRARPIRLPSDLGSSGTARQPLLEIHTWSHVDRYMQEWRASLLEVCAAATTRRSAVGLWTADQAITTDRRRRPDDLHRLPQSSNVRTRWAGPYELEVPPSTAWRERQPRAQRRPRLPVRMAPSPRRTF